MRSILGKLAIVRDYARIFATAHIDAVGLREAGRVQITNRGARPCIIVSIHDNWVNSPLSTGMTHARHSYIVTPETSGWVNDVLLYEPPE